MSIFGNTWSFFGYLYALASLALMFGSGGNGWLEFVAYMMIGVSAFCFGARFQEYRSCTCAEESDAKP